MSGWDAVRRVPLAAPWQDFWVEVYLDPEMGIYIDMQKALTAALRLPNAETLTALVSTLRPLVGTHNITDRAGQPLEDWSPATMGAKLITGIADAISAVQNDEGGETADPLPGTSPARGSRRSRSRRTTSSGASASG